jgi:hypothetical protein
VTVEAKKLLPEERPDPTGKYSALFWRRPGGTFLGIYQSDYLELVSLAHAIQKTSGVRNVASFEFLKAEIFQWLTDRHDEAAIDGLCDRLDRRLAEEVVDREIWIPIHDLFIEREYELGVRFRTLTKEMLEPAHTKLLNKARDDGKRAALQTYFNRLWRDHGLRAIAMVPVRAEPEHAADAAFFRADRALGCLRLFSSAHYRPESVSTCVPKGAEHMPSRIYFYVRDGEIGGLVKEVTNDAVGEPTVVGDADFANFQHLGWTELDATLKKNPAELTEFENEALASILLYSRAATSWRWRIDWCTHSVLLRDSCCGTPPSHWYRTLPIALLSRLKRTQTRVVELWRW